MLKTKKMKKIIRYLTLRGVTYNDSTLIAKYMISEGLLRGLEIASELGYSVKEPYIVTKKNQQIKINYIVDLFK